MKKRIIYRRIAFILTIALLILSIGAQSFPLLFDEPDLISQPVLQSMRTQKIAKDALILEYRSAGDHAQAISEIQNTLPVLEAKQTYLQGIHNADAQALLIQAQPDYVSIDTATRKLVVSPSDMTQVQIILLHERNYSLLMAQLSTLMQERVQSFNAVLIAIQCSITLLILLVIIVLFVLSCSQPKKEEVSEI